MQTLNISLPKTLSTQVDRIVKEEGYASRSEFFRTILRLFLHLSGGESGLEEYKKEPLAKVESELKNTGLYSQAFIKSVVSGLAKSSVYGNKAAQK